MLKGIDLTVPEGTVLALLGPNGAGKTTTVRILTTLLKPDSGTVRGQELIEQFGLTTAANRPVQTYSGGMRRRLDLAASLIAAPPVLFLDEPTTGLDPESRNKAWEVMRSLARGGTTLLLTTQYIEEADQLADTATIIDHGRIITSDTPARLKDELGGERLDVKLADPTAIETIPELREKALPIEIRKGTLSFWLLLIAVAGSAAARQTASGVRAARSPPVLNQEGGPGIIVWVAGLRGRPRRRRRPPGRGRAARAW